MSRNSKTLGKLLTLTLLTSVACYADLIGPFSISGTATVSATGIDFNAPVTVLSNTPTDDSNPLVGSVVDIGNLTEPIGTPINVPNWLTTTTSIANPAAGDVALTLMFLPVGAFTPTPLGTAPCGTTDGAVGNTCTPIVPNSPSFVSNLSLINTLTGYSATFDAMGTAIDKDTGTVQNFDGIFTAAVSGVTYQSALNTIAMGGTVTVPFAANFTFTAVPEPSYLPILGGIAIAVIGLVRFRKSRTV